MSVLGRIFRSRDKPQNMLGTSDNVFYFGRANSGKVVTERSAIQLTALHACVRVIAETVASLPLHLYEQTEDGGKERATKHPLYRLLHDEPNPEMTSFTFRETMICHLLLWGNFYAQIIRNGRGEVIALYPLMPDKMKPARADSGQIVYQYTQTQGATVTLPAWEVLHVPGLGFDGLLGYSPIAMARNSIGMAIATEEYGATFFSNGASPGGVLEHPGTLKDPNRIRDSWNAAHQGSANANRVAILEEGMKFHQISVPPDQAQFLETRQFQVKEIARLFRVPPHMIGDLDKSSFSNIEQQSLEFVKYTIDPWVVRIEQAMYKALLSETEKGRFFMLFNLEGLLRGDYESRMRGYAIGLQNGWMSPNDICELENRNRIPAEKGGDEYLINGNMVRLSDVGAFAKNTGNSGNAGNALQKEEQKRAKILELGTE